MTKKKKYILDSNTIDKKMERLALEVIENNADEKEVIIVGIRENGVVLARNIQSLISKNSTIQSQLITVKLNKKKPKTIELSSAVDFNGQVIILVDDVTNTGKTLLYALKPFLEAQPKKIEILVLVERTHTQYPITANYKGISLATTLQNHIYVEVVEDKISGVYLS